LFTPLSGSADEIIAFQGSFAHGKLTSSGLRLALPSGSSLWILGPSGRWLPLAEGDVDINVWEILCATDGPPPSNFLPSKTSDSQSISDAMAAAVDTAFSCHAAAAAPLPVLTKSKPVVSAMQLFGSPVRALRSQTSQPRVTFMDKRAFK
jgi:hypothetical protein